MTERVSTIFGIKSPGRAMFRDYADKLIYMLMSGLSPSLLLQFQSFSFILIPN